MDNGGQDLTGVKENVLGTASFSGAVDTPDPLAPKLTPAPDGIPEKFWDPEKGALRQEELLRSYAELEKQFSSQKEEPKAEEPKAEEPKADEPKADEEEPKVEVADAAAFAEALDAANVSYRETGDVSKELREKFNAMGINDFYIDTHIQGVKAAEAAIRDAAVKAAGVQSFDEVQAAIDWAAAGGWSEKKANAFNAQAGDVETIGPAVIALMSEFRKANPTEGKLTNVNSGATQGDVYTNFADFQKELGNADRLRDGKERSRVIAKMRRSRAAGSIQGVKPGRNQPFSN